MPIPRSESVFKLKDWPLWARMEHIHSPHRRRSFMRLKVQLYYKESMLLWVKKGIDDASVGTARRARYRNRRWD
jgi:hypothetical protein